MAVVAIHTFICPLCPAELKHTFIIDHENRLQHGPNPEHSLIYEGNLVDTKQTEVWLLRIHRLAEPMTEGRVSFDEGETWQDAHIGPIR